MAWRKLFQRKPGRSGPAQIHRSVGLPVLSSQAHGGAAARAALLRDRIPQLEIRIVGNGPEYATTPADLFRICSLESTVRWLGDVSMGTLAAEYNRADLFCLPSVQEGFGIVFLEAMAAGKPIVAARAAAVPEVVRDGILVEPENPEALAEAILRLYRDPDLRHSLGSSGLSSVEKFDMRRVAGQFLAEIAKVAPGIKAMGPYGTAEQALR